jgi:hypothetical protein
MSIKIINKHLECKEIENALSNCILNNENYIGLLLRDSLDNYNDYKELYDQMEKNVNDQKKQELDIYNLIDSEKIILIEDSDKDSDKDPDKDSHKDPDKDSHKDSDKDSHKDSDKDSYKDSHKDSDEDSHREIILIENSNMNENCKEKKALIKNVKEEVFLEKCIKIKLLCNWTSTAVLTDIWNKMSMGNYGWNNIRMIITDDEPDYYVVINMPPVNAKIDKSKTIVFRMEPNMDKHPELWGEWAKPNENEFHKVFTHECEHNNIEWHINKTYTELKNMSIDKDNSLCNIMSTVLSSKYKDPGHIKRIDFVKFLDSKSDIDVHVFGDNKWSYKNYRGDLPYHAKDLSLLPYKYCFNVENHSIENYFTEKIVDGILSECLVFYHGCPNIRQFLPKDSFVWLELSNFDSDYELIKNSIRENLWEKRLSSIKEAKKLILDTYQFFPRLEKELIRNI